MPWEPKDDARPDNPNQAQQGDLQGAPAPATDPYYADLGELLETLEGQMPQGKQEPADPSDAIAVLQADVGDLLQAIANRDAGKDGQAPFNPDNLATFQSAPSAEMGMRKCKNASVRKHFRISADDFEFFRADGSVDGAGLIKYARHNRKDLMHYVGHLPCFTVDVHLADPVEKSNSLGKPTPVMTSICDYAATKDVGGISRTYDGREHRLPHQRRAKRARIQAERAEEAAREAKAHESARAKEAAREADTVESFYLDASEINAAVLNDLAAKVQADMAEHKQELRAQSAETESLDDAIYLRGDGSSCNDLLSACGDDCSCCDEGEDDWGDDCEPCDEDQGMSCDEPVDQGEIMTAGSAAICGGTGSVSLLESHLPTELRKRTLLLGEQAQKNFEALCGCNKELQEKAAAYLVCDSTSEREDLICDLRNAQEMSLYYLRHLLTSEEIMGSEVSKDYFRKLLADEGLYSFANRNEDTIRVRELDPELINAHPISSLAAERMWQAAIVRRKSMERQLGLAVDDERRRRDEYEEARTAEVDGLELWQQPARHYEVRSRSLASSTARTGLIAGLFGSISGVILASQGADSQNGWFAIFFMVVAGLLFCAAEYRRATMAVFNEHKPRQRTLEQEADDLANKEKQLEGIAGNQDVVGRQAL